MFNAQMAESVCSQGFVGPATLAEPLAITIAMPKRIGYARAAIDDLDMTRQLSELEQAKCVKVFVDHDVTAADDARPDWQACLAALNSGDILVVSRIERLARTLTELTEVLSRLSERRAELRICHWDPAPATQPGDLAEIVQRLVDFESANRREFIQTGLVAARAEGRIGGRRHKLTPEQVKELRAMMALPGADPVAIGMLFGVGRRSVYNYMRKEVP
jgi:DNA invertase Pin-like site-specific DNA recombinase